MDMTDSECYPHHHIKLRKWEFHTIHKLDSHNFFNPLLRTFFFIAFGGRGREGEKHWCEREILIGSLPYGFRPKIVHAQTGESNPQPRHVHWPEIKCATCQLQDNAPTNWATLTRAGLSWLFIPLQYSSIPLSIFQCIPLSIYTSSNMKSRFIEINPYRKKNFKLHLSVILQSIPDTWCALGHTTA